MEYRAFKELKESISMSAYHDSNERSASSGCLIGTRIDQIKAIMEWIELGGGKKPFFLVLGPTGSGKTSLLNTIAENCKRKGYYAAGFFFSSTDSGRNTSERLINTIAYQIAVAIPQLRPYISRIIAADSTILSRSLDSKTISLLLEPLRLLRSDFPNFFPGARSFVIVVDALDECGISEEQRRVIAALAEAVSDESFPLMCLLSSRFNPHIERGISTTLAGHIQDQVVLGKDDSAERADIRTYLGASMCNIRNDHVFGERIPREWPSESDLETIVQKSHGQFIYASTVIRYIQLPNHAPHERLRYILGIPTSKSGRGAFTELDALYRVMMSSIDNIETAIKILGIELVGLSSQFRVPAVGTMRVKFEEYFRSLNADIVLAPLASVLKCEGGKIQLYHTSFAEFLLDSSRSCEYFVQPRRWQAWMASQPSPFDDHRCMQITAFVNKYLIPYSIDTAPIFAQPDSRSRKGLCLLSIGMPFSSRRLLALMLVRRWWRRSRVIDLVHLEGNPPPCPTPTKTKTNPPSL